MNKNETLHDFDILLADTHVGNWSKSLRIAKSVYKNIEDAQYILMPFMYTYLEESVRSMTTEYGALNGSEKSSKRIGGGLVDLAISESDDSEQQKLLRSIKQQYFRRFDGLMGGGNRNNVDHGVVPANDWSNEEFQKLVHDVAALTPYTDF